METIYKTILAFVALTTIAIIGWLYHLWRFYSQEEDAQNNTNNSKDERRFR